MEGLFAKIGRPVFLEQFKELWQDFWLRGEADHSRVSRFDRVSMIEATRQAGSAQRLAQPGPAQNDRLPQPRGVRNSPGQKIRMAWVNMWR